MAGWEEWRGIDWLDDVSASFLHSVLICSDGESKWSLIDSAGVDSRDDMVELVDDMDEYCDGEYSLEQECKRKGMPVMECPNCNADFYYSGETKTEEGSYWIDEDEPSPF